MEVLGGWQSPYQQAVFIDTGITDNQYLQNEVEPGAKLRGWAFQTLSVDLVFLRGLVNGDWVSDQNQDFLVIPPHGSLGLTCDDNIYKRERL